MFEERRRLIRKVLVLSWERDGEEEACSVSGATDGEVGGSWTGRRKWYFLVEVCFAPGVRGT